MSNLLDNFKIFFAFIEAARNAWTNEARLHCFMDKIADTANGGRIITFLSTYLFAGVVFRARKLFSLSICSISSEASIECFVIKILLKVSSNDLKRTIDA